MLNPLIINQLINTLKMGQVKSARKISKAIRHYKLVGVEEGLFYLLGLADQNLRRIALNSLKHLDTTQVNQAVRKVMDEDPNRKLKDLAAQILSKSKDAKIAEVAQFHALRSTDAKVVLTALQKLEKGKS